MTVEYSGTRSTSNLLQSEAGHLRHRYSHDFRVLMRLSSKGDVLCVLKIHSSWVYIFRGNS